MAERTEREVLNHLIEACKDGERGYRYAANHVTDSSVKALFTEVSAQRERFAAELLPHAQRLGGANESDGTTTAALHRGWITVKDTLTGHDAKAVFREVERGEDAALAAYRDALDDVLAPTTRDLVERQYLDVQRAHDWLRSLRAQPILDGSKA